MTECTPTPTPANSLAGRDRWEWIQPVLFIGAVTLPIVCMILALTNDSRSTTSKLIGAASALSYSIWSLAIWSRLRDDWHSGRIRWPLINLVVSYSLFAPMVLTNPVYFFLAFLLYWFTFAPLPLRWSIPLAIALSIEMIVLQLLVAGEGLADNPGVLLSSVVSIAFGVILAIWIGGIIEQSGQRAELIGQLEATRTELANAHHEAGVAAERERLANEIHDTLAQGFTSIVMLSQAVDTAIEDDPEGAHRLVQSIERTARENLAEARHLVEGSGPAALEDASLVDALERLTERLSADVGIDARTEVLGDARPLPSATEVALLRAAQEAVANVRKHAHARHVVLTLDFGPPAVALEVADDGRGFDPSAITDGFGLSGMRQRMARAGGELEVTSAVGAGTTVKVRLS